ncbi:O-linked N-acetylglucosamine transferase family protein [Symbiopectobacterium sp.]|uniref:O-linked N-acetylglucosamine transferase family protein n=1 Tax=Symbiopectobacterium sp. TaxID=2952789 RepID=UPI003F2D6ECE
MAALDSKLDNKNNSDAKNTTAEDIVPTPMERVYGSVEHIRAVSWLYCIDTVPAEYSRTLVLGCEDGLNLLPFATAYPSAQIVGVELASESLPEKQKNADILLPTNLHLYSLSLEALLGNSWENFDYIIVQGSFSLLANEVTDLLLAFFQQKLSAKGIIALDWFCQPGAKSMEALRDAIQLHSCRRENFTEQVEQGKAMLSWLNQVSPMSAATESRLDLPLKKANALSDDLFTHYFLESKNESSYLVEFNNRIENCGLAYVGDVRPETETPDFYNKALDERWQNIAFGCGKVMGQQYLDIAVNRSQRFSLLVLQSRAPEVSEQIDYSRLADMRWAGGFRRQTSDLRVIHNSLASHDGVAVSTDNILTMCILDTLGDAWPYSVSFDQLVFHCRLPDDDPESPFSADLEKKIINALKALLNKGISSLHFQLDKDRHSLCNEHHVAASESVKLQLQSAPGSLSVINLWQEVVGLTEEEREQLLLPSLTLTATNRTLVDNLHHKGVLNASALGWKRYYQQVARNAELVDLNRVPCALLLFSSDVSAGGFYTRTFELLANETDTNAANQDEDSIDGELVVEINSLLIKSKNEKAIALVEHERERLLKTINGCYYLSRFYRRVADDASTALMLTRILSYNSTSLFVYSELAMALYQHRVFWTAGRLARAILRCNRKSSPDWFLLGLLHKESKTLDHAEYCARQAIALVPNSQQIVGLLGGCLCEQAKTDEGIAFLRKAIRDPISDYYVYSQLAFILSHSKNATAQELMDCHLAYAKGEMAWAAHQTFEGYRPLDKSFDRKLRIGFVSGDLRDWHPVGFFFTPIWDKLDRKQFELYCYNNSPSYLRNAGTDHFEATADAWRDIQHVNPIELAEMIKTDKIDILIDLSGHTGYNRLSTFALKPAPIQISWVGYHATTGLPVMDYYATIFPVAKDPVIEAQFTEKLIYLSLPNSFDNKEATIPVNPLPALKNGYFTFGSFNRPNKINDDVLDAWAEILKRVPTSRMRIGNMPSAIWAHILENLHRRGIDINRVKLFENMSLEHYFQAHNDVDLLLDTFPFSGGTVTNHAVWMGVPTISLAGETLVSRQGASIMQSCGLSAFIGYSKDEFIEKAVLWSSKTNELNAIRLSLRDRVKAASDGAGKVSVSDCVGQMWRECWRRYCLGLEPESFSVGHPYSADQ